MDTVKSADGTVVTYDRRGRGDSGDTQPFAAEKEYQDLAAVAAATGPVPPFVFGHSSGAAIGLRAAAAGLLPVAGIVAYEAPFRAAESPPPSVDPASHIRRLVSSGRSREAVAFWMSDVVQAPAEVLAQMEGAPWAAALEPLARSWSTSSARTGSSAVRPAGALSR